MGKPERSRNSKPSPWPWLDHRGKRKVDLILVGDTNVQDRASPPTAFAAVRAVLRSADVVFGHLEGPFARTLPEPATPDIPHKPGWRHSDPAMVQAFVDAGFSAVSCASNVTYGARAVEGTITTLDSAGIAHCGAGRNRTAARRPALIERKGVRFGFLSYTSVFWPVGHAATETSAGVATIKASTSYQPHLRVHEMPGAPARVVTTVDQAELAAMVADVRRLRRKVDVLVVSCHWGVSSSSEIQDYQRCIGRAAIEAGADIVMGHHPHVLQAVEVWQGRPILYSLGNFAFDWFKMKGNRRDGLLVRGVFRGSELAAISLVPVRRDQRNNVAMFNPQLGVGADIMRHLQNLSAVQGTKIIVEGCEARVLGIGRRQG